MINNWCMNIKVNKTDIGGLSPIPIVGNLILRSTFLFEVSLDLRSIKECKSNYH